jgi:hypothetical protein
MVKDLVKRQLNLLNFDHLQLSRIVAEYETRGSRKSARLLALIAKIRPIRDRAIRLVCHLEGGQIWSIGFRELMQQHTKVGVRVVANTKPWRE